MQRSLSRSSIASLALAVGLGLAFGFLPTLALAQGVATWQSKNPRLRQFPDQALRGVLEIKNWPNVLLNYKPQRLAPGARIKNTNNMLTMPVSLKGRRLVVNYTLDRQGQLREVWILTPQEALQERAGPTFGNVRFESEQEDAKEQERRRAAQWSKQSSSVVPSLPQPSIKPARSEFEQAKEQERSRAVQRLNQPVIVAPSLPELSAKPAK